MGCENECSAEASNADFPYAEIKLLLDMILGNTEFDLVAALKAIAVLAEFAMGLELFTSSSTCSNDVEVAALCQALLGASSDAETVSAQGLFDALPKRLLLDLLIKKALEWLQDNLN